MSECDVECRLCGPLGCLRPHRITMPEFLRELDRAAQRAVSLIVFPPNFLNHPEASQFCFEVARRGFTPLIRLRPSQLVTASELLSTLEYRRAQFEVVVASAIPFRAFDFRRFNFKTVFLPSRLIDPVLLFDSIPYAWRKNLEVLAVNSSTFEHALSADEIALFARGRALKTYTDSSRAVLGHVPGARESVSVVSGDANQIRLSVVLPVHRETDIASQLASFEAQSLESGSFEVILACDRVSDDVVESLKTSSALQILRLPEAWGEIPFRQMEAFNLAAVYARGSQFLFLPEGFPIERDLLKRCSLLKEPFVRLDSQSVDKLAKCAHLVSARSHFASGGYPSTDSNGFEFATVGAKRTKTYACAAQDFFLTTLDLDFYSRNFSIMGKRPWLRQLFRSVAAIGVAQPLIGLLARMRLRSEYEQAMKVVKA